MTNPYAIQREEVLTLLDPNDPVAVRNTNKLLDLYQELVNDQKGLEATGRYLVPGYIQHNPWLPTTAEGTARGFAALYAHSHELHVKVYRTIAVGNYVWAHTHFMGFNDDQGRGRAVIDIFRFNADGMIEEHWDAEQQVEDPAKAANNNGMFKDGAG